MKYLINVSSCFLCNRNTVVEVDFVSSHLIGVSSKLLDELLIVPFNPKSLHFISRGSR